MVVVVVTTGMGVAAQELLSMASSESLVNLAFACISFQMWQCVVGLGIMVVL